MTDSAQAIAVPRPFDRAQAPKTAEIIASRIRKQIATRELQEGDNLPSEVALMEQFGVSRPTLREAFRILETESLISVRRGARGGARITAPSLSVAGRYVGLLMQMAMTTIGEIYQARAIIERAAARLFADHATPQGIEALQEIVRELSTLTASSRRTPGASMAWYRLSWDFHEHVVEGSQNSALAIQWRVLRDVIETHMRSEVERTWDLPRSTETKARTIKSYSKLLEFVAAGDADGAEAHWRAHMEASASILTRRSESKAIVDVFD